jgi:hypothetical protein
MLFAVFPIITFDPFNYYTTNTSNGNLLTLFNVRLSVWYSMASSVLAGCIFTLLSGSRGVVARDFINCLIAGGVASCSGSFFFTNPVYAMVLGSVCGFVQAFVQIII